MQKKLIALAVAGLSTAAFAQTNVTIYGVADVSAQGTSLGQGVSPNNKPVGSAFNMKSNSSLIGFKGTEDLGNGLNGLFQIETNVNLTGQTTGSNLSGTTSGSTTSTGMGSLRDSFVGLNSKYGTVMGGYLTTPYRSALISFDVLPGATGDARIETLLGKQASGALNSSVRASALAYAMPTLYGFTGSIAYTGSASNGNNENVVAATPLQSALAFNLGWSGYGVDVKGAFSQAKVDGATTNVTALQTATQAGGAAPTYVTTNQVSQTPYSGYTSYLIGASYTGLPGLKASVVYNRNSVGVNSTTTTVPNKGSNNQVYVGVAYRFGNNEPRLTYATSSNTSFNGSTPNDGATQWGANWGYYLSKRTQVYGLVTGIKNNQGAAWNVGSGGSGLVPTNGNTVLTYGAGIRTNF